MVVLGFLFLLRHCIIIITTRVLTFAPTLLNLIQGEGHCSHSSNSSNYAQRENFQSFPYHDSIARLLLPGNGDWMFLLHGTGIYRPKIQQTKYHRTITFRICGITFATVHWFVVFPRTRDYTDGFCASTDYHHCLPS